MALKKRGFNVDRLLNQEREERLRVQAEREQRQQQPVQRYDNDKQSIRSENTNGPSTASSTLADSPPSSILDQVAKRKPGFMGKLPSFMESMPGSFNSKRNSGSARLPSLPPTETGGSAISNAAANGSGGPARGGSGGAPGHTTKEVSGPLSDLEAMLNE